MVLVVFEELYLLLMPFRIALNYTSHLQFFKQTVAFGIVIRSAQIVQVCITDDLFQNIFGLLRYSRCHDHVFYHPDIAIRKAMIQHKPFSDAATIHFMVLNGDTKACIVHQYGQPKQFGLICIYFLPPDILIAYPQSI